MNSGATPRVIDTSKCIGCCKCVNECVNRYLTLSTNGDGKTVASFVSRGRCLECGHCNAICPQGAISGGKVATESIDEQDELLSLMGKKRSVRKYIKGSVIPQNIMEKILLAGQSAPTNRNRKSARIVLIKDALPTVYDKALDYLVSEVQKTGTINPLYVPTMRMNEDRTTVLWNAEYLVLFVGLVQNTVDAAISAERMQLEAYKYGIGSAYRGDMQEAINNTEELRKILDIKMNEQVLISFVLGQTEIEYQKPAVKFNRKVVYK